MYIEMGCSWFNTETNKKKTSINNKNMHQIRDKKSPVNIPVNLWELLGGRSPPYQLF
jgi:hypothetical protein